MVFVIEFKMTFGWHQSMVPLQAYQLFKARAYGADAVLLIAAVLPNKDLEYLVAAARKLGLQCLIEVSYLCTQSFRLNQHS